MEVRHSEAEAIAFHMKRVWKFLLVGPLIGFAAMMLAGYAATHPVYWIMLLAIAYLFGAPPALAAFAVDHWLWGRLGDFKRAAVVALAGYVALLGELAVYHEKVDWALAFAALPGAIAGLICSLMSSEKQNGGEG
jgi:hypothetical protein